MFGDLPQIQSRLIVLRAELEGALQVFLGLFQAVVLQRKQAHGINGVGIVRGVRGHALELHERFLPFLLVDQEACIIEPDVGRARVVVEERFKEGTCLARILPREQKARLEQRRLLPVRTQFQHFVDGSQGFIQVAATDHEMRHGEMRRGAARIQRDQRLHHIDRRGTIAGAPQHGGGAQIGLIQMAAGFLQTEKRLELALGLRDPVKLEQRADHRFSGLGIAWPQFNPQPCRLERLVITLGIKCGQRRALGNTRIARLLRHLAEGRRRHADLSPLTGNLTQQQVIKHFWLQADLGKGLFGLGGRRSRIVRRPGLHRTGTGRQQGKGQ